MSYSSVILGENILLVHSCCVNSSSSVVNKNGCTSDNVKFNTSFSRFWWTGRRKRKGRLWNKGSAALKRDKVVETPVQIVVLDSLRISSSLSILDKLGRPLWGLGALRDSGPSGWNYLIHDPFLDFPSRKTQKNILLVSGLRKEISPQKLPLKINTYQHVLYN